MNPFVIGGLVFIVLAIAWYVWFTQREAKQS